MIDASRLLNIRPIVAIPGLKVRISWYPHPTRDLKPIRG